jgi:hypothetical protein
VNVPDGTPSQPWRQYLLSFDAFIRPLSHYTWPSLASGSSGQVLTLSNSATGALAWTSISSSSGTVTSVAVSGQYLQANGAIGGSITSSGTIALAGNLSSYTFPAAGSSGQVLTASTPPTTLAWSPYTFPAAAGSPGQVLTASTPPTTLAWTSSGTVTSVAVSGPYLQANGSINTSFNTTGTIQLAGSLASYTFPALASGSSGQVLSLSSAVTGALAWIPPSSSSGTTTYVTPQQFGAVGDGVADDTTALSNCLNSNAPVFLGNFDYKITSQIIVNTVGGAINSFVQGGGYGQSRILLASTSAVITINVSCPGSTSTPFNGAVGTQCVWKDVVLVPIVPGVGNLFVGGFYNGLVQIGALNLVCNRTGTGNLAGSVTPTFYLSNVSVAGDNSGVNYAFGGIILQDMRNGSLINCTVMGHNDGANRTGSGIVWWASVANSAPVSVSIIECEVYFYGLGVEVRPFSTGAIGTANDCEGLNITNSTIISCNVGVNATTVDYTSAYLTIRDTTFGCQLGCVLADNWWWVIIDGCSCLIENFGNLGTGKYTAVYGISVLTDANHHVPGDQGLNKITNNIIQVNYSTIAGLSIIGVNNANGIQTGPNSLQDLVGGNSTRVAPGLTNSGFGTRYSPASSIYQSGLFYANT